MHAVRDPRPSSSSPATSASSPSTPTSRDLTRCSGTSPTPRGSCPRIRPIAWLDRFLETSGHLLAGHPDLAALAASLRLMLLDAPEGIDPGRLESLSLLPPLHLRPLWRRPRLLGALVREACLYETAINALAFSVNGRLASGGSKGILRIWDSELLGQPTEIATGVGSDQGPRVRARRTGDRHRGVRWQRADLGHRSPHMRGARRPR